MDEKIVNLYNAQITDIDIILYDKHADGYEIICIKIGFNIGNLKLVKLLFQLQDYFIERVMAAADVSSFYKLMWKFIRIKMNSEDEILSVGHILSDIWYPVVQEQNYFQKIEICQE